MKTRTHLLRTSLALVGLLALASCRTIQYREVQSDFERAVQAETARTESPFVDWYQGIADTLTDDFIGKLDVKLQPNAWMLRGLSEWRSGAYSNANRSASKGLSEIERQQKTAPNLAAGRDSIVLTMLPGLVQDSQLRDKLRAAGTNDLPADSYRANFFPQFKAVLTQFEMAKEKFAAPTPPAIQHYWNYHLWRALQNWRFTLGRLPLGEFATKQAYTNANTVIATQFPKLTGGTNLTNAIAMSKQALPAGHTYLQLIEIEEKK